MFKTEDKKTDGKQDEGVQDKLIYKALTKEVPIGVL